VAEQHHRGPGLAGHLLQRGVPGLARRGFRAPGPREPVHGHPDLADGVQAEGAQARRDAVRLVTGAVLEAVVHGHAATAQPQPWCLMGQGGRQGQRVGAARAGSQDEVPRLQVTQAAPDTGPGLGYRRVRAHRRSAACGQRASAAHPVEPQLRPVKLVLGREGLR